MNVDHRIEKLDELLADVSQRRRALLRMSPRPAQADQQLAGWSNLESRFRSALSSVERQLGAREMISET